MLGAVAGDIIGSSYEFIDMKRYDFELLPEGSRFTDDSVMTIAVAHYMAHYDEKGLTNEQLISTMQEIGRKYPYAGYGSSFNCWLWSDDPQPYNSWGNGAAMRVSPAGLYAETLDEALDLAERIAQVSHNHPEGIKGAQAVAAAVWMAKHEHTKTEIRKYITDKFKYDLTRTVDDIHPTYQWDESCQGSVPESIICFLEGKNFEDVVRLAVSLGGDSDTMACIAGSIAACIYPIPEHIVEECEKRLTPELLQIMRDFEKFIKERNQDKMKKEHFKETQQEEQTLNVDEVMALQMMQYPVKKIRKIKLSEFDRMCEENPQLQDCVDNANDILDLQEKKGIVSISCQDQAFPARLLAIGADCPAVIHYKGNLDLLKIENAVAIIGARAADKEGNKMAYKLGKEYAENGYVVVSGLALGCDASAHRGCLDAGGKTIAIVGNGLDITHPRENKSLEEAILNAGGLLLSEQPIGVKANPTRLVARNRLQAALSEAVILAQCPAQSGSMHTMRFARKYGRKCLAATFPKRTLANAGNYNLIDNREADAID